MPSTRVRNHPDVVEDKRVKPMVLWMFMLYIYISNGCLYMFMLYILYKLYNCIYIYMYVNVYVAKGFINIINKQT